MSEVETARRLAWPIALLVAATAFGAWAGGLPLGWLVLTVALIALVLPDRVGRNFLFRLPAAATVLVAAASVLGLAAGFLGIQWLNNRAAALLSAIFVCGVLAGAALLRQIRSPRTADDSPDRYLLLVPLAAAVAVTAVARIRTFSGPVSWYLRANDHMSHLALSVLTSDAGSIDYGQNPYPRGLHALLAWAMGAFGPGEPGQLLDAWVHLWAAFELLSYGLLLVAIGAASLTVLRTLGTARATGWIAVILLIMVAFPAPIFGFIVRFGFATTIAAAWMLLAAVPLGLDVRTRQKSAPIALIGSAVLAVAVANTWLMVAVAPALMCAWWLWRSWRDRTTAITRRASATITVTLLVCAMAAIAPLLASATQGGLGQVSESGSIGAVPTPLVAACLVSFVAIVAMSTARLRAIPPWAPDWSLQIGLSLLTVAVLMVATGASWSQMPYYPHKMEWYGMILSLPAALALVAAGIGTLVDRAAQKGVGLLVVVCAFVVAAVVALAGGAVVASPGAFATDSRLLRGLVEPDLAPPRFWEIVTRPDVQTQLGSGGTVIAWHLARLATTANVNRAISVWPQSEIPTAALAGAPDSASKTMCAYLEAHPDTMVLYEDPARLAQAAALGGCTTTTNGARPVIV